MSENVTSRSNLDPLQGGSGNDEQVEQLSVANDSEPLAELYQRQFDFPLEPWLDTSGAGKTGREGSLRPIKR